MYNRLASKIKFDLNLVKYTAIFALIYFILFNSAVLHYKFGYYRVDIVLGCLELVKESVYIYVTLFLIFIGLMVSRVTLILGSLFLFISGAAASYYLFYFKLEPTEQVVKSVFSTNLNEAMELISIKIVLWIVSCAIICISLLAKMKIQPSLYSRKVSILALIMIIFNIISPQYKFLQTSFPMGYLRNIYICLFPNLVLRKVDISEVYNFIDQSKEDVVGIILIGESARYDHFGINGYARDTTPRLNTTPNLVTFKARSAWNFTHISVRSLLSRQPSAMLSQANEETSFLSIFSKLKFDTSWFGTQSLLKYAGSTDEKTMYDEVNFELIPGGSVLFKMNAHDEVLLPYISHELNNGLNKKLLVIHSCGSHWRYNERYPDNFKKYQPTCPRKGDPSSCNQDALINSYDNSIFYTDFFITQVIDLLKNKNAFLLYVSDHGESLGEDGVYMHGSKKLREEQMTVPLIVWVSDKFKAQNPDILDNIKSHKNDTISHDYVFHTILDCLGISSEIIDPNLSLCKPKNLPK